MLKIVKQPSPRGAGRACQLKVTLKRIRPPVWRRIRVPGSLTLFQLHDVIQTVFGWHGGHLHQFLIDGAEYGEPADFDEDVFAERSFCLAQLVSQAHKRFLYTYDFGDDWEHEILVEKITPADPAGLAPMCLAGKRHRPPEDCGGPWGYAEFLEAIRDPKHPEHDGMLDWYGGDFDPEKFDLGMVNRLLASHGRS